MKQIQVLSVNISEKKGTVKHPVPSITLSANGVEGDAHSGPWNRQVSLLGVESIRKFERDAKRRISYGEFAENITTEGIELWKCQPLDRFVGADVDLEVTQIGKECHGTSCSIFKEVGNCVMPKEGIFARVIGSELRVSGIRHPASLSAGMELIYQPKIFSAHIITLSDRAFAGEYEDRSGPRIRELLEAHFAQMPDVEAERRPRLGVAGYRIAYRGTLLPDDPNQLRQTVNEAIAAGTDFIFTTGGTGIGPRDFTPDVIRPLLDKEIPGIMEMIRMKYGTEKRQALLSRGVAGVADTSLVFTLPGSVRAVNEYMEEILQSLMHMVYMVHGLDNH